jgi:hypothetical protein
MLVALLFVGSVSASAWPAIPSPPYNPKSPQEDIVTVAGYLGPVMTTSNYRAPAGARFTDGIDKNLYLTITFAATTPLAGQTLNILVTQLKGNPPTEKPIFFDEYSGSATPTYLLPPIHVLSEDSTVAIAVYAWLGTTVGTDRAPNGDFYQISSFSAAAPNQFDDPEGAVGGVIIPTNKTEILAPFLAIAGIVAAISTVELVVRRRKD